MKIDQYCQQQRCEHVELNRFLHALASHGFVSDSWAFLLKVLISYHLQDFKLDRLTDTDLQVKVIHKVWEGVTSTPMHNFTFGGVEWHLPFL